MTDQISTSVLVSLVIQSILFLAVIISILYFSFSIIRHKNRNDKPKLKWLRIASQILASTPFLLLIWLIPLVALQFFSESFAAGCTSGPGIGSCFAMMVLTAIFMYITPVIFIVGVIAYYLSTTKREA